jgi:hypothetical protein
MLGLLGRALFLLFFAHLGLLGPTFAQEGAPPSGTFTVEAFQADLFTGAATTQIPIVVPPGPAGVAPQIGLRYNSSTVDELDPKTQGQSTGLGWTLDTGGFILRDTKNTTATSDDTFKLVFGGVARDLVLVDTGQNLYRTKEDTFWQIRYDPGSDYWTLKTKDGTTHRFGFNTDSKAITLPGSHDPDHVSVPP